MQDNNKLVSIIVITFNRSKLLLKCVQSILRQTFRDFELLIIDDGSEDKTNELVNSLDDTRIKYFNFGKIGNLSKLRNIGINNSSYDYIGFCDDDDMWHQEKLDIQLKYMNNNSFCCSNADIIDINDKSLNKKYFPEFKSDFKFDKGFLLKNGNCILTSSILLKKNLITESNTYFDELKFTNYCEDYEFCLRLIGENNFFFTNENLIYKRLHESVSMGLHNNIKMVRQSIKINSLYVKGTDNKTKRDSVAGIIGYRILLVKLSFRENFFLGITETLKFILFLFKPLNMKIFFDTKLLKKFRQEQ